MGMNSSKIWLVWEPNAVKVPDEQEFKDRGNL